MKATVLVVDDDPLFRQMVRDTLQAEGYEVQEAVDGLDGIEKAERLHPDVILLDIIMPGLEGFDVCRALKANPATKAIPVIIITISTDRALSQRAYEVGATASFTKPFRPEALLAVVEVILMRAEDVGAAAGAEPRAGGAGR